jgi:hypothetical protein
MMYIVPEALSRPKMLHRDIQIVLDFDTVQRAAERVRERLVEMRSKFDLSPFEYCAQIRIAPTEIPHSHPQITLNTWPCDDTALLSTYLHEQMHWYVTWYSHTQQAGWAELFRELRRRYAEVPVGDAQGGRDTFSTYLHLLVNWLEIESVSQFIDSDTAVAHCRGLPFYRWIYATVLDDWEALAALYGSVGLLPMKLATTMSSDDLRLAAMENEAPA